jgi:hypothetical protein
MRTTATLSMLAAAAALVLVMPTAAAAQSVGDLLASVQRGGGWVSVPIKNGAGHVSTATVPTVGMTVAGCIHVWGGHTGRWDIHARDALGSGRMQMKAGAGESVPFTYTAGMRSQLEIDFAWSEPRDTTLYLWVGLARPNQPPEATCEPVDG